MSTSPAAPVHVAAGVIRRVEDGAILLSLRPHAVHQGGLWEFPGGKLEAHESPLAALARELAEELGIRIAGGIPLIRIHHHYPDKHVLLDVLEVRAWEGRPHGREGQTVRWVAAETLPHYRFPAANQPIVTAARLPSLALTADFTGADDVAALASSLERCLAAGLRLLRLALPAPPLPPPLAALLAACRAQRAWCTVAVDDGGEDPGLADGVHVSAAQLARFERRPAAPGRLLSASCRTVADVHRAAALGADFVYAEPGPGGGYAEWPAAITAAATMPVFAAGPVRAHQAGLMRRRGCQGIAVSAGSGNGLPSSELVALTARAVLDAELSVAPPQSG